MLYEVITLEAMGRLVEARETALEVTRFDNAAGNATFAEAMSQADEINRATPKTQSALLERNNFV